jgi:amino acid-DNA transferase-like protein
MAKRDYARLDIETFGRVLITSGDLDPIYIALARPEATGNDLDQLKRWLVAYWCFYHAGVACWLSEFEGKRFWDELMVAAQNVEPAPTGERWPRGHERRHARGAQAERMVNYMRARYDKAEKMVDYIISDNGETWPKGLPFEMVSGRTQEHTLFGPWIGFKVADMVDRVLGVPVNFFHGAIFMFDDPTKAAIKLWAIKAGMAEGAWPKDKDKAIGQVVNYLIREFCDLKAPPFMDRPIGLQEVETVLCKWKSHLSGHYPLFNDIDEITDGVKPWTEHCKTAKSFLAAMPIHAA